MCREVVVSLFYPAQANEDAPQKRPVTRYLPNATAEFYDNQLDTSASLPGLIERIFTYNQINAPLYSHGRRALPLLVFSPGFGVTFRLYTTILEEIARNGYIVAAIDHPYDAAILEFPNGKVIREANLTAESDFAEYLAPRLQDVSFVLDELSRPAPSHPFAIDTSHVVAFGHSLGGDTAVEIMLHDKRIFGGMNWDGNFEGELNSSNHKISKPVLLFGSSTSLHGSNWENAWRKLVGWKLELDLAKTTHLSFSDLPLLADVLGLRAAFSNVGPSPIGPLSGLRGLEIISSYVTAFAEFVFAGDEGGSLKGKLGKSLKGRVGKSFPEVEFVRKGGPQRDADVSSY